MSKPTAVIFDCDGTLVDVSKIRMHLDPTVTGGKNFHAFHAAAIDCPPHDWVVAATHAERGAGHAVVIVTAREAQWAYQTMWWLLEHGVEYSHLFTRARRDYRPDHEVKAELLAHIRTRYNVVKAYDDRPSVVALWESEGIETITVPGWVEEGL